MELSKEMLQNMEQADIRDAVLDTLTDISKIEIDRNKPIAERVGQHRFCRKAARNLVNLPAEGSSLL